MDPVDFRTYVERIDRGGKLPIEEQARIVERLLGSDDANEAAVPILLKGLAGTGKTVLLAMTIPELAIRFQRKHGSPARILVYHFNNYLHRTLRREIDAALRCSEEARSSHPPQVVCANYWGLSRSAFAAMGRPVPEKMWRREDLVPELLRLSVSPAWERAPHFDIVLVDEGQDLTTDEFRLLKACLRQDERLIVAYDDFQNVMSGGAQCVRDRFVAAIPDVRPQDISLTTCVRSNPVVFSMALSTLLGPTLVEPDERATITDAIGLDAMLDSGALEEIPWPGRSGFYIYIARFCLFPEGPPPRVMEHANEANLHMVVARTLRELSTEERGRRTLHMTILVISIVNVALERLANGLAADVANGTLPPVVLRSGATVSGKKKRTSDVVAPGVVNLANVHDAKGAEADIVFVIDPDTPESRASDLQKRALFYVAATRAKVLLQVDGIRRGEASGPIMTDAMEALNAFDVLTQRKAEEQGDPRNEREPSFGTERNGPHIEPSPSPELGSGFIVPATLSLVTGLNEDAIISITRGVDSPGTNLVDAWMDQVPGAAIMGGFGHRFVHGHHLIDAVDVYQQYGLEGVWDFAHHMGRDLCTPHGLPIPGGGLVFDTLSTIPGLDINLGTAVEWLSFNVADLLSASLAGLSLVRLCRQSDDATTMFLASGVKFAFGTMTGNPLVLIGAAVGTGIAFARVLKPSRTAHQHQPSDDTVRLYDSLLPLDIGRVSLAALRAPEALILRPIPLPDLPDLPDDR